MNSFTRITSLCLIPLGTVHLHCPAGRPCRLTEKIAAPSCVYLDVSCTGLSRRAMCVCHLSHVLIWEYNIPQRLAVARHVASGLWLKCQSRNLLRPAKFNSGLRAREACRAAFARFVRAHELTGRVWRRGRVRYHRAASILIVRRMLLEPHRAHHGLDYMRPCACKDPRPTGG